MTLTAFVVMIGIQNHAESFDVVSKVGNLLVQNLSFYLYVFPLSASHKMQDSSTEVIKIFFYLSVPYSQSYT